MIDDLWFVFGFCTFVLFTDTGFPFHQFIFKRRTHEKVAKHNFYVLKMLGLYLYTLIFSHKSCKMLSIQNKLKLQKDLQNIVTNNVFMDKK